MTPDVRSVLVAAQAVAEDFGGFLLDQYHHERGAMKQPDPTTADAKIAALQHAAEQASYRYARSTLIRMLGGSDWRDAYVGIKLLESELDALKQLIAERA